MPNLSFDFANSDNWTDPDSKFSIGGNELKLTLQNDPGNDFIEDFADDTDFVYTASLSGFSAGQLLQTNKRPTNGIFYASYTNNINGSWGDGTLTGTATGGASVAGGELNLSYNDNRYVDYDAVGNADMQQTGCIIIRGKTNYSGSPASTQYFCTISAGDGLDNNRIMIYHTTGGLLSVVISDNSPATILTMSFAWNPTAGAIFEIALNFDITTGATRIFLGGTQQGSTDTSTGTRTTNINLLRTGNNPAAAGTSNFYILDLLIYDAVQHTTNYTPDWSNIREYDFIANNVICPEMVYTGAGTLIEATNFVTSISGSPKVSLQIARSGNYLYYESSTSAWTISSGDYDQANTTAEFLTNISTLPVLGEIYGQFKIHFPNSNTQSAISNLTITLTSQAYPTTNPYVITTNSYRLEDIRKFITTSSIAGSDAFKFIFQKDDDDLYYSSGWIDSDGTYSQSNTDTELNTNAESFSYDACNFKLKVFAHSEDGTTTPILTSISIPYTVPSGSMVLTTSEIKAIMNETSTDYDDQIQLYRPIVQDYLLDYCENELHNLFLDDYIYTSSDAFTFDASAKTVTAEESDMFTENPFQVGDYVFISGAANNNGMFTLSAVTGSTLTFGTDDIIIDEDSDLDIRISKINFPRIFEIVLAQLVWENVKGIKKVNNVTSERLDTHSKTYGNNMNAYSDKILGKLAIYNQVGL